MAAKKRTIKSKTDDKPNRGEPKALFNIWHDETNEELNNNRRKAVNFDGMLKARIRKKAVWTPDEVIAIIDERLNTIRQSSLPRDILLQMRSRSGGKNVSFASYIDRCRAEGVDLV